MPAISTWRPRRCGTATASSSATTSSARSGSSTSSRRHARPRSADDFRPGERRMSNATDSTAVPACRLATRSRHRWHVHRCGPARRSVRSGRGRQDAHNTVGSARRRAYRRALVARKGRRAPGRDHRAHRARHHVDHQRPDRGQDRSCRCGHHRRLRRHARDPQRAPLRHVRPADRVPCSARPSRSRRRDRRTDEPAGCRGIGAEPGRICPRSPSNCVRRRSKQWASA